MYAHSYSSNHPSISLRETASVLNSSATISESERLRIIEEEKQLLAQFERQQKQRNSSGGAFGGSLFSEAADDQYNHIAGEQHVQSLPQSKVAENLKSNSDLLFNYTSPWEGECI